MLRLRLLGTAELRDADGAEIPLTARKRFALLAYLALGASGGFRSRDDVMAVFWPELDEARARAVLRQTLRLLRRDLGREVVESRGSELGLRRSAIWCDAVAFEELLEAGREAEAVDLYAGPLLNGFHYPRGSRGFEDWREGEARRLRERAVRALWRLVDAEGGTTGSERRLQRLLRISPYDETALRWLMRSLAGRGNRAEAVQLYEAFVGRLASELELEPSTETRALAEAIRLGGFLPPASRVPEPSARTPAGPQDPTSGSAHVSAPALPAGVRVPPGPADRASGEGRTRRPPLRRRGPRYLRAGAALILVGLAGWFTWSTAIGPEASEGPEATMPLLVLPFEYRGDPQHAYVAAGIPSLIGDNLDGAGPIRTLSARWEEGGAPNDEPFALARHVGARLYLTGDILEAGGSLRVRAALHDGTRPGQAEARATAEGTVAEVFALADRVATALLREAPSVGVRSVRSAGLTTTSLPALRAYLEGEDRLRAGRYDEAITAFEAAIREDTAFALAYHRLSTAAEWAPRPDLMTWATEAAVRHADRLPLRERSLLEATLAWRQGDADEAEQRYRGILRMYPDDGEAWFQLGEVLFHLGPLRGRPIRESETAWRRVLDQDPENLAALIHLARVLSAEGRLDELDEAPGAADRQGRNGDRRILQIRALQAVDSGSRQARSGTARRIREESDAFWVDVWYVLSFARNLEAVEPLLDLLVDPGEPVGLRALGHVKRAHARVAQGRWEEARAELAAATSLDPATGLVYRGYLTTLPFVPASRGELERLRGDLIAWDADGVPAGADPRPAFTIHDGLWPVLRHYLIGAASVRLGDLPEAELRIRALVELAGDTGAGDPLLGGTPNGGAGDPYAWNLAADLARGLGARIAVEEERLADGLDLLEGLGLRTTFERAFLSPFHARAWERHLRGELLLRTGRDREARLWFESAAQLSPYELAYLPFAHLSLARLHERAGEPELARRHFLRYRMLWTRADPAWRDAVERELRAETAARP